MESSTKPVLQVVIASTRPGRVGEAVARWIAQEARQHGGFDVEVVDLAEVNLPFLDEPNHPKLKQYQHDHTKAWSATVDRADAFVFVTPEYNHGITAPLKNAIDFLHQEWASKPLGVVSYGGVAAGTRAVQQIKQVAAALKLHAVPESVNIPFVHSLVTDGELVPNPLIEAGAKSMLDELARVAPALATLRHP